MVSYHACFLPRRLLYRDEHQASTSEFVSAIGETLLRPVFDLTSAAPHRTEQKLFRGLLTGDTVRGQKNRSAPVTGGIPLLPWNPCNLRRRRAGKLHSRGGAAGTKQECDFGIPRYKCGSGILEVAGNR